MSELLEEFPLNHPTLDLIRVWVYPKDFRETGSFIYPQNHRDRESGPSLKDMGQFYFDWNHKVKLGHETSLSRSTRFTTPPNEYGGVEDIYDGDIVKVRWQEGLREIVIVYSVDYFPHPENGWALSELGDHDNREYILLKEVGAGRSLLSMDIVGHRWQKQYKKKEQGL